VLYYLRIRPTAKQIATNADRACDLSNPECAEAELSNKMPIMNRDLKVGGL
jgi:hypothetical protein